MENTLDGYKIGKVLGTGASAKVVVGEAEDSKQYALKIFDLSSRFAKTR